ncbi:MAG: DUF4214 domain-containing protein [Sphingomonadaceae bacterium]
MSFTSADDYANDKSTNGIVPVGGQINGNIELPNDKDWFKVTLQAGTTYVFDLLGADGGGGTLGAGAGEARLVLFDSSGYLVDSAINNGSGGDPRMSFTPQTSGSYFLEASDLFDATGSYVLKATSAGTSADDYGNSKATLGTLTIGGQVSGALELPNDTDWFKVSLQAGATYVFDLLGADGGGGTLGAGSGEARLVLMDANGYLIDSAINNGSGGDPRLSYTAKTSGTVYLEVTDLYDGIGSYTLKAASGGPSVDDYAASTATLGSLSVGGQSTGNLELPNDHDWFKVTLQAGTTYVFDLLGADGGGGTLGAGIGEARLVLLDANGYLIDSAINNGVGGDPRLSYSATTSGAVYLEVSDLYDGTGSYTLKASAAAAGADDYADSRATTGTLAIGGQSSGTLELPNDKDWFKLTLQAGSTYVFDLLGADAGGGTLGAGMGEARLVLFDANGYLLDSAINNGLNGDPRLSYSAKTSGTVYLEVSDLYSGTGSYTLKASSAGVAADDYGNSTATKGVLDANGRASGSIELPNDTDWLRVELQAGTTYVFDLLGADGGGGTLGAGGGEARLVLYDAHGYQIDSAINNGIGGDPRLSYTANSSGSVFLGVSDLYNGTGSYTVHAWAAGSSGNDVIPNTAANDKFNGGNGLDTIAYAAPHDHFVVSKTASGYTVVDQTGVEGSDTLVSIERIHFSDQTLALDINGAAGQTYRIYQAAFNRTPDSAGLGYWIAAMDRGTPLNTVAGGFVASAEFKSLFGEHPSNTTLASGFYTNVLHRQPDQAGLDYWVGILDHSADVAAVLIGFSESAENQAALAPVIGNGFAYTPYG